MKKSPENRSAEVLQRQERVKCGEELGPNEESEILGSRMALSRIRKDWSRRERKETIAGYSA